MLGKAASIADTLNFAATVVAFFELKTEPEKAYELVTKGGVDAGWQLFEELPVDIAMRDGGWKLLAYEYGCRGEDPIEFAEISISERRASYVEPYGLAPCDRVQSESKEWLNVSLRPNQIPVEHLNEFILDELARDNDEW